MIKADVLAYLSNRSAHPGETVQYGWFIFRLVGNGGRLDIETLDFKQIASFTDDFSVVERIHHEQLRVLEREGVDLAICNLQQYAIVSKSYRPDVTDPFMNRTSEVEGNDSGWYVGVLGDSLDMNDPNSFEPRSLYEVSIHDHRFVPFWLLPSGFQVLFDGNRPITERSQGPPAGDGPKAGTED